jgi:replication-associated recombination protein RarA
MELIDLNRYAPVCIADIIFGNPESKAMIDDVVSGRRPFPAFGKNAILLYGTWGTGKTTLAKMLPAAIEPVLSKKPLYDENFVQCKQGMNGPDLMRKIESQSILISANHSDKHYFILDEIDNLTELAQASLKAAMNLQTTIFVMTTNHIEKLDRGLLNRSIAIDMNAAPADAWLPLARRMLEDFGVSDVSDDELVPLIHACKGSVRNIADSVLTIAVRKGVPANIIY